MVDRVTSYRYGEGETIEGQVIQFTAPSEELDLAKDALKRFRSINVPTSGQVNVEHGGYGRYSRYEVEQVRYAGGQNEVGGGYYEILNIKNAPNDRHPIVSHGYMNTGQEISQFFAEWETVGDAQTHWDSVNGRITTYKDMEGQDEDKPQGLIRVVNTGYLSPWFYATGDASLVGDYVFPEHLTQDPTFTFGRPFLVPEKSDRNNVLLQKLKTCMGCTTEQRRDRDYYYGSSGQLINYRVIQWHDGSVTRLSSNSDPNMIPTALAEQDLWVTEAQQKFTEMLAGQTLQFEVQFADGGKFVGKYVAPADKPKPTAAGDYLVSVSFEDGEASEGWVNDFTPTEESPNIATYITNRYQDKGRKVARIETIKKKTANGTKQWPGVFHAPPINKPQTS